jgi:hypothetical protein
VILAAAEGGVSTTTVAWIAVAGTLLGSLIGATAGGVVDYILERSRSRKRATVAARLIRADLAIAAKKIAFAEAAEAWKRHYDTPMSSWSKYEDAIADQLSGNGFKMVSTAALSLAWFDDAFFKRMKEAGKDHIDFAENDFQDALGLRADITNAYNALAPLARESTVRLLPEEDGTDTESSTPSKAP